MLLHDSPAAKIKRDTFTKSIVFAAGESCNSTGSLTPLFKARHGGTVRDTAGRQLPTAISQRHGHGRAPDHHGGRSVTPDRHGRPGPIPVAASPQKRRQTAAPKFGRFWLSNVNSWHSNHPISVDFMAMLRIRRLGACCRVICRGLVGSKRVLLGIIFWVLIPHNRRS